MFSSCRIPRLTALVLGILLAPAASAAGIPQILLPAAEVAAAVTAAKPEPLRYAVDQALNLDLRNGAWDEPETGIARWRLQLHSAEARTLSATLENLRLPAGAELWFYDPAGGDRQGPLLPDASGSLWTPLVRADTAVLEVRVPAGTRDHVALTVRSAQHGYRDPFSDGVQPKGAFGNSGSCNINAACSEGDNWRPQIRSAVLITVSGSTLCSGTLVNNVRQDNRPLILTANHCGVRSGNVTSTRVYFNVQKPDCSSTVNGPVTQNIAGSSFLARDERSDFTLFTLDSTPSATFNAYYAGWNASSSAVPQSGVTIHHPAGDDKKISVYSSPAQRVNDVRIGTFGGFNVDAWQVTWSRGTTQGGSSGAGLWDQNRRVVGILSGGSASCTDTDAADFFARFERAWLANSATTGQLKAHLDPDNRGCLSIAGKEPGAAAVEACAAGGGSDGGGSSDGGALGSSGGAMPPLLVLLLAVAANLRRRSRFST